MRVPLVSLAFVFAVTACMDDGDAPKAPGIGEVVVYEPGPHVAQCEGVAVTLAQSRARLASAGIDVRRSSCGHIAGVAYPAVCGAGTGQILLHDIPDASLAAAEAAGFGAADTLHEWQRGSCPHYLHAIDVARDTLSCAGIRDRVMMIQNIGRVDDHVVLLDQAGHCADASFRQVLFGGGGEDVLCTNADSIAGPQKHCDVPSRATMFDIILANLDQADLGLGSAWHVSQVFPAD